MHECLMNNGTDANSTETNILNSRLWHYSPISTNTFTSLDFNDGEHYARSSAFTRRPSTSADELEIEDEVFP